MITSKHFVFNCIELLLFYIFQFIKDKNKDQNLPGILQMNKTSEMKNNITSESSYTSQFKIIGKFKEVLKIFFFYFNYLYF